MLRSDLSLKDAAKNTDRVTQSSVNYLHERKTEYSRDLLNCQMSENFFFDIFFFRFDLFFWLLFSSSAFFFIISYLKIIRCIVKLSIATSTYFLLNTIEKNRIEKCFFGVPNDLNTSLHLYFK